MAKISIIIPAFNMAQFIGETLESVLRNETDMDIVVVDDASTDNTCEIVEQYAARHANIRLMRGEINTGPGVARNRALATVDSEYCLFHDADDLLEPGAVDTVLAKMDGTDIDVAVFKYKVLRTADGAPGDMPDIDKNIWNFILGDRDSAVIELDAAVQILVTINYPWNKILRTSFIRRTNWRFATARINEDILPHWAAYMNAGRFLAINESLAIHRLVPGREQHTNTFDERRFEMFGAFREAEKLFEENPVFRAKYYPVFIIFKAGLIEWASRQIREDLQGIFREYAAHSYRNFTDEDFDRVYRINPAIALASYRKKHSGK
ncbi:glycosyltransferase family 2 protein [Rhizobium sp. S152]|uniref:glycosyltransferase family 2 protein n=1 Tax=Rhizobium sp. S152 TaxID=3055038 RepID=UPI0025AA2355|nr:glycosyltransferase family 2 protein [Rhizobium sp. S152]MDM9629815.1 glycosyltransferase family 2 protein [Rhizobium sp. S152]